LNISVSEQDISHIWQQIRFIARYVIKTWGKGLWDLGLGGRLAVSFSTCHGGCWLDEIAENSDLCRRPCKEFANFANSLLCNMLYINDIK